MIHQDVMTALLEASATLAGLLLVFLGFMLTASGAVLDDRCARYRPQVASGLFRWFSLDRLRDRPFECRRLGRLACHRARWQRAL